MNVNADLVGRYILRMAAEIEGLIMQRDALAEEVERLKKELNSETKLEREVKDATTAS